MSAAAAQRVVRVGGAAAFWGDSSLGPIQLVERGNVDYLVLDYLAETTMAILAAARLKKPDAGYATDFVDSAMRSTLVEIARRRIRVVTNAGGINPHGCRAALEALAMELGVSVRVAIVEGDDIRDRIGDIGPLALDGRSRQVPPAGLLSANAYLGAAPIAMALQQGADIVVTGRCVDSALTLGPLLHEFGWPLDDYDRLAAGSLAGHIIECGCQGAGGLFTDWREVSNWPDSGYPILECASDGSFTVTKPASTGGLVQPLTVAEQLVYEIGDPQAYVLPDVVCDFSEVRMQQTGVDRVRVTGARGSAPTSTYKVSATYRDGYRCSGSMIIIGIDAAAKARRTGEALLDRMRFLLSRRGLADFSQRLVEVIGAETSYGPHARTPLAREVMMRVTVVHPERAALELFAREVAACGTSWSPGTTMPAGGRPTPSPMIKQIGFLVPKAAITATVSVGDQVFVDPVVGGPVTNDGVPARAALIAIAEGPGDTHSPAAPAGERVVVPLVRLACARSGDKGDRSNIGLIARRAEYLDVILSEVTPAIVAEYFAHLVKGPVKRYLLPGIGACNFVLDAALGGGGTTSLRLDPLGKGMAQMLLDLPVRVPAALLAADTPPA
jgi:hypothetical protein